MPPALGWGTIINKTSQPKCPLDSRGTCCKHAHNIPATSATPLFQLKAAKIWIEFKSGRLSRIYHLSCHKGTILGSQLLGCCVPIKSGFVAQFGVTISGLILSTWKKEHINGSEAITLISQIFWFLFTLSSWLGMESLSANGHLWTWWLQLWREIIFGSSMDFLNELFLKAMHCPSLCQYQCPSSEMLLSWEGMLNILSSILRTG